MRTACSMCSRFPPASDARGCALRERDDLFLRVVDRAFIVAAASWTRIVVELCVSVSLYETESASRAAASARARAAASDALSTAAARPPNPTEPRFLMRAAQARAEALARAEP